MKGWQEYQNQVARLFADLGCAVEVDPTVQGARGRHKVDVLVRFPVFGLESLWVIECKYWTSLIPKEKVLVLRSVVEDVGADRGILVSEQGYQKGAHDMVSFANITIVKFSELRELASRHLLRVRIDSVRERIAILESRLRPLRNVVHHESGFTMGAIPGVDNWKLIEHGGALGILKIAFDDLILGRFPVLIGFVHGSEEAIMATSADDFAEKANDILAIVEDWIEKQRPGS